ncbi:hypothetical protein Pla123a_05620 [Posidoniimonas polymericola]|uniref:Carboxypeptidase regulatory-like domain-containing protein n=1 Tax=Posidoniimonas polymericola TaxID=2528002 RepID=A0A5C5ZF73_9BACT|nr:hypothetical protein [Posidoniimonas polymericola]TWT85755.1 hypothetical protein Pla123a_05620 [Posidoniimonas polymericola]
MPVAKPPAFRLLLLLACLVAAPLLAGQPCKITVVDAENGWPVPLVELTTTSHVEFVTDNAGVVAFDLPEFMGRETWLTVASHGYEVPQDGFGYRGVRVTPTAGGDLTIKIERKQIAKRLGRLTGSGLFAEAQQLGEHRPWRESGVVGSDTAYAAEHRGRLHWIWGDTGLPGYPLGIFQTPGAVSELTPLTSFEPPIAVRYDYFRDQRGKVRNLVPIPGKGPTWTSAVVSLPDTRGEPHLVGTYAKIPEHLAANEMGLVEWNEAAEQFERVLTFWKKSDEQPKPPRLRPDGHVAIAADDTGREWAYFGGPPNIRCPATYEAWRNRETWEPVDNPCEFPAAGGGRVAVASADLAWSDFRQKWVMIVQQKFGDSVFGEVWYLEGDSPTGPWGPAVKIASHNNYTFYNIQIDRWFADRRSPVLLFEGTYTHTFTDNPHQTPRWDYNQVLYRLDLDDPSLAAARRD